MPSAFAFSGSNSALRGRWIRNPKHGMPPWSESHAASPESSAGAQSHTGLPPRVSGPSGPRYGTFRPARPFPGSAAVRPAPYSGRRGNGSAAARPCTGNPSQAGGCRPGCLRRSQSGVRGRSPAGIRMTGPGRESEAYRPYPAYRIPASGSPPFASAYNFNDIIPRFRENRNCSGVRRHILNIHFMH